MGGLDSFLINILKAALTADQSGDLSYVKVILKSKAESLLAPLNYQKKKKKI